MLSIYAFNMVISMNTYMYIYSVYVDTKLKPLNIIWGNEFISQNRNNVISKKKLKIVYELRYIFIDIIHIFFSERNKRRKRQRKDQNQRAKIRNPRYLHSKYLIKQPLELIRRWGLPRFLNVLKFGCRINKDCVYDRLGIFC